MTSTPAFEPFLCWTTSDIIVTPEGPSALHAHRTNSGRELVFETDQSIAGSPYCPEFRCCVDI